MMLAIWDDGVWQDLLTLAGIGLGAYLVVMWIAALMWTYRDVQTRTRDQFTQMMSLLLVAVFNLPGLLIYLVLRPKQTLADMYDRQLEAEALLHELQEQATCPACRRKVADDFLACPYCRSALRTPCESCSKPMMSSWVLCPYCGADRPTAEPAYYHAAADDESAPGDAGLAAPQRRANTARYTPAAPKPADPAGGSGR
jgi:hypothetical protein